jgi:HEAT repeat protein
MKHYKILTLGIALALGLSCHTFAADTPPVPDFTAGGKKDESHDWLLGPTGLRGWMYFRHQDLTAASRQILITAVDKGSPADGILQVNDVILGTFGKPFTNDARRSFGHAIAAAEAKTGILTLTIWRNGKTSTIELKLQILGAYSATAPYDCPKSKAIFEQGCRLIAEKGFENADIPDHLNALALLASGDKAHHSTLGKYAKKVAESLQAEDTWNWYIAYGNLFLSEYTLATGKKTAFSELKQTTMRGIKNQCMNGMWGHAPSLANGHSEGYGGMNVIGLPMTISFVLAREAGISDPALDKAIDKSAKFLRYYVDKGAIPYGDHLPWISTHDDNGKASCAAVLFDMLGDREATCYFSNMATAAYDEREQGHCGNFWNMLWAVPGASRGGPLATGAYLKEQAWYYDLSRTWKGAFVYQQIEAGEENNNYNQWDLTGGYLLSFGLYQKTLHILGKKTSISSALNAEAMKNIIIAGRDRFPEGDTNGYFKRHDEELIEGLKSWSPIMRHRSAKAIGKRGGDFTPTLLAMLNGTDRYARYGAAEALGHLGKAAASALPQLRTTLQDPDTTLQYLAADALASLGDKDSTSDLFAMTLRQTPTDPRRMHQRTTSRALFSPYPGNSEPQSLLANSLDGVDRKQLHLVLKALLQNDDSVVRASIIPSLEKLSDRELAPLLPDIIKAIETLAPTNEMWGDDIRQSGLNLLSQRHIREGMPLCVSTIEWRWGLDIQKRMEFLTRYGKHAREVLPGLKKHLRDLEKREEGQQASDNQKIIKKTIAEIEASKDEPKIITLKDFIARASKSK